MKIKALDSVKRQKSFYLLFPKIDNSESSPLLASIVLEKVSLSIGYCSNKRKAAFKLVPLLIPVQKDYGYGKKPYPVRVTKIWI
jgi:hypothetical protein